MKTSILQRVLAALWVILPLVASPSANIQISSETVPSGGWVEIKISLTKPQFIASGHITMDLDPKIFGPIQAAGVFGANGDAYGLATITGEHLDAQFYSPSAGIGQLAGLPVVVVSVPVLALAQRAIVPIAATVTLNDISGNAYSVTVIPGSVTVGGAAFSVQAVQSGMGVLPTGSVVPILGTGFTASTTAAMDGVAISSAKFVSPTEIDVTLAAPAELTGKQLRIIDGGVEVDYFCFDLGDPQQVPTGLPFYIVLTGAQPMFPLQSSIASSVSTQELGGVIAIENPQTTPVTMQIQASNFSGVTGPAASVTLPAGGWGIYSGVADGGISVTGSAPVRVVGINRCGLNPATNCPVPAIPSSALLLTPPQPVATPASVAFQWQIGSAAPAPRTVFVTFSDLARVATSTTSTWLSVTQSGSFSPTLTITVDPSQLTLGTYQGSVLATPSFGAPLTIPVTLTVTDTAPLLLTANPTSLKFTASSTTPVPVSQSIAVTSTGPAPFSVVASAPWIQFAPLSATTPATIRVTYDPSEVSQLIGAPQSTVTGTILIDGPGNSLSIPVQLTAVSPLTTQTTLVFSMQTGSAPQTQTVSLPPGAATVSVNQPWLSALYVPGPYAVGVTVNPSGLAPGIYNGIVTVTDTAGTFQILVTLSLWSVPPPLQVTPSSITITQQVGEAYPSLQSLTVQSGSVPLNLTIVPSPNWVVASAAAQTPASIRVGVTNTVLMPLGQYDGTVALTAPSGTVNVPVTLLITPGPVAQPVNRSSTEPPNSPAASRPAKFSPSEATASDRHSPPTSRSPVHFK